MDPVDALKDVEVFFVVGIGDVEAEDVLAESVGGVDGPELVGHAVEEVAVADQPGRRVVAQVRETKEHLDQYGVRQPPTPDGATDAGAESQGVGHGTSPPA